MFFFFLLFMLADGRFPLIGEERDKKKKEQEHMGTLVRT